VKIDDRHVAWLRAQIGGRETSMRQITARLSAPDEMDPLAPLLHHAFVLAVRKAFGPQFTHGEVIRLVANVRTVLSEMPGLVDPVAAESEIRRALGEPTPLFPDPNARAAAQLAVLDYLVHDLELGDDQTDSLLDQARQAAVSCQPR
jgi:hypothetical protein